MALDKSTIMLLLLSAILAVNLYTLKMTIERQAMTKDRSPQAHAPPRKAASVPIPIKTTRPMAPPTLMPPPPTPKPKAHVDPKPTEPKEPPKQEKPSEIQEE